MSNNKTITIVYTVTYSKPPFENINNYLSVLADFNNNNNINSIIINQTGYPFKVNDSIINKINIQIIELEMIFPLSVCRNQAIDNINDDGFVLFGDEDILYEKSIIKLLNYKSDDIIYGNVFNEYQNSTIYTNIYKDLLLNILTTIKSATIAYSKVFIKENKFDEDFGVGSINPSSEETELLLRAYYKKYTIGFIDKTLCSTEIKDIIATDYKKIISYAFGLKEVLFKYKSLLPKTYYLYIKFKPLLSSLKYIFTQHALSKRLLVIFFVNIIGTEKRINKYV